MERLDEVLRDLDRRLSEIERRLELKPASPAPRARPEAPPAQRPAAPSQAAQPAVVSARAETAPESGTGSFFGVVGIGFLLLAAVFFLKLTIDSGWLTPERQVLLAALFGLFCLFLPHLERRLSDDYGALLSGAGAAVLHVTWLGAYEVHHLIDAHGALVAATMVGVISLLMNARHGNAVFVVVAIAGTYLAAPLIGYRTHDFAVLSTFLLIWNITYSGSGFLLRRRDVLLVASWFAVVTVGVISLGEQPLSAETARSFLVLQGMQFAVFAGANFLFSVLHERPLGEDESWAVAVLLLIFYAHAYSLLSVLAPALAPWTGVALASAVLLLYGVASRALPKDLESTGAFSTFGALVLLHSLYFKLTPDELKPAASLALGVGLAFASRRELGRFWRAPCWVAAAAVAYGALLSFSPQRSRELQIAYHFSYGLLALALAGALLAALSRRRKGTFDGASVGSLLLGFGHLEMLSGLYQLSRQVEMSGSLFVSLTWGLYALGILAWGYARRDRIVGQSAVLILAAVALKAAFYDTLQTTSLSRVLSLLAAGSILYACGWVFRRMGSWAGA